MHGSKMSLKPKQIGEDCTKKVLAQIEKEAIKKPVEEKTASKKQDLHNLPKKKQDPSKDENNRAKRVILIPIETDGIPHRIMQKSLNQGQK